MVITVIIVLIYQSEHSSERELRDLYNELNILVSIGNHPNVVSLIGACSVDGELEEHKSNPKVQTKQYFF